MEFISSAEKLKTKKTEGVIDKNSPEFLQAKAERIEKRRARIAAKIAKEKGINGTETGSTPSSLDFLHSIGAVSQKAAEAKAGQGQSSKASGSIRDGSKPGTGTGTGVGESGAKNANGLEYSDPALDTQMEESRHQLQQIILDGETLITNVKVAAEYREKTRHDHADESKKERLERLQTEAEESQQMYENINEHWLASAEKMLPMELYSKIQEQKKACDDLLEKQDEEIYNLKKELEDQDIEYENNLEMYQKDIMLMGDRIDDNIDTLRNAFMEELELIEEYTVQDREQLLEENQKEWMNLLKEYEELEKSSLEERKNDALNKFERLTDLYGNVKQEARLLKNKMLTDMRTLFVEREKVKCAIQLNLEKLDYNLAVLRKREEENMRMKNSMKRLLLKLQDRFNAKSKVLQDKVSKGKKQSDQLIKDIRRLESLCDDAKRKTLHIYASDYHKFMDLWLLNEIECREKLCRLLGSERYIVEEQLGTGFFEPDMSQLDERPPEVQCFVEKTKCCEKEKHVDPFEIKSKIILPGSRYPGGFGIQGKSDSKVKTPTTPDQKASAASNTDVSSSKAKGKGKKSSNLKTGSSSNQVSTTPSALMKRNSESSSESASEYGIGKTEKRAKVNVRSGFNRIRPTRSPKPRLTFSDQVKMRNLQKDGKGQKAQESTVGFQTDDSSKVTSMMSFLDMEIPTTPAKVRSETSLLVDPASDFDFCPGPDPDPVVQRRLMKHITKVICDQTGFLLEDKLRKIMLPLINSEKNLIHIDTVLQALGVDHIGEMQLLARYMLKYSSIMKGIISKASIRDFSQERMNVSASGVSEIDEDEDNEECEYSSTSETTKQINILEDANRLTPSTSATEDEGGESRLPLPDSAVDVLTKSVFVKIGGIKEVHGLDTVKTQPFKPGSARQDKSLTSAPDSEGTGTGTGALDGERLDDSAVFHIIEEFSSDESLAKVLKQVEKYGQKIKDGTLKPALCAADEEPSSSSCSCDSDLALQQSLSLTSRVNTGDDPFGSNKATVLSWVTEVAAGLTDCRAEGKENENPEEYVFVGDGESYIEEIVEVNENGDSVFKIAEPVVPGTATTAETALGSDGSNKPGIAHGSVVPGTGASGLPGKKKKRRHESKDKDKDKAIIARATKAMTVDSGEEYESVDEGESPIEEEMGDQEFEKKTTKSSCASTKTDWMSGISLPTTGADSTEFFYIEPNDVLRALAAFCRDHKSKVKSNELPTKSQMCDNRIASICFPSPVDIKEYWDKFLLLLDPKSKILWDGILDVFNDYHENLKVRNAYVEDIVKYYKQNYELSHLLKKHIMTGAQMCRTKSKVGPFNRNEIPYCGFPCSSNTERKQQLNYPSCPAASAVDPSPQLRFENLEE